MQILCGLHQFYFTFNCTEAGKKLQSMARNANPQLFSTYLASYDGDNYDDASFDEEFFMDNVRELLLETEQSDK